MSHRDLANAYREAVLSFVWRQWGQMGVSASAPQGDRWCQDPEALLLFSLEVARWEPRMFDEILDWLAENGQLMMRQRITNIVKRVPELRTPVAEVALDVISGARGATSDGKGRCSEAATPLFLGKFAGRTMDTEPDADFLRHGLLRPRFERSQKSQKPSQLSPINLAFRLRAIFGASSRSEALRFLLARRGHEASTTEVAEAAALSRYSVHQALEELAASGVIRKTARSSKDLRWWLDVPAWLDWMHLRAEDLPVWVDWLEVYPGLMLLWRWLESPERETESRYIRVSRARELMEALHPRLANRGLPWHPVDPLLYPGESYWPVFREDMDSLAECLK